MIPSQGFDFDLPLFFTFMREYKYAWSFAQGGIWEEREVKANTKSKTISGKTIKRIVLPEIVLSYWFRLIRVER